MKRPLLRALSARSTVVGIVGVASVLLARILDVPITDQQQASLVEGILVVVSVVAIMTREEEPYDGVDRRTVDSDVKADG